MICDEQVYEEPGYFHTHRCGNRARFAVSVRDETQYKCGVHVKWYGRHVESGGYVIEDLAAVAAHTEGTDA